jgi:hypothetical protein
VRHVAYISAVRTFAIIAPLLALLAVAGWFAVAGWNAFDSPMPLSFWLALGGGVFFSLLIGVGLMALVYYSHRHGYDDITIEPQDRPRE